MQMSIYGAEFVEAAPQLLGVEGEDPPNLQFKVGLHKQNERRLII